MSICVNSIGDVTITLKKEGEVNVGDLVQMSKNQTAKKAVAESDPIGVCLSVNGEYMAVLVSGGVTLNCDDSTLEVGFAPIKVADGNKIKKGTAGKTRLVVDVDKTGKTAQVIL